MMEKKKKKEKRKKKKKKEKEKRNDELRSLSVFPFQSARWATTSTLKRITETITSRRYKGKHKSNSNK
jgi:hypothetical protein